MITLIQSAFQKTHARYCKILNNYYPAHKSAGFTGRNLTGNFVYCLEQLLGENAISWFEVPINLETKEHIDAVVFDMERRCSIQIEAKRFSNPDKKIIEAKSCYPLNMSPLRGYWIFFQFYFATNMAALQASVTAVCLFKHPGRYHAHSGLK